MVHERLVVDEDAGHAGYVVTRETEAVELTAWAGTGPGRGEYEDGRWDGVEYIPPLDHEWRP